MDINQLRQPLVYHVSEMELATCHQDIVYTHVNQNPLLMDVYSPPNISSNTRLPGVLFLHGGPVPSDLPLQPKDWGVYMGYGALAAASGFIGITFNYRYNDLQCLPDASANIQAAIQYIRTNADEFHLDNERIAIWAFSGGGPYLRPILRNMSSFIRCIAAFYTLLDLRDFRDQFATDVSDDLIEQFSPLAAVERREVKQLPMLLARAGQDNPMINQPLDKFVQAALEANLNLTLLNHPDGQHGFDALDDTPRTHEIIKITIKFLQRYLTTA